MNTSTIILVSGPSGGGKSTFIYQLKSGGLSPEIISLLPKNIGDWPVLELNDFIKGDISHEEIKETLMNSTGCIAHYDIVMAPRLGIAYELDPAIRFLIQLPLSVEIFIRPNLSDLIKQFEQRRKRLEAGKSVPSLIWRKYFKNPLKRIVAKLKNKNLQTTEELYRKSGWLENCCRRWEVTASTLSSACRIIVTPQESSGDPLFHLVSNQSTQ